MAENTREIVLDILLALERGEDFSHRLVRSVLDKYNYLEERDKAFIKRLAEGTIERQTELDYYLDSCSSVPVCKMKPLIRCLMRMSVYQLCYMDNVPDSAVCNEACRLAQKRKFGSLKGFVNGVLRRLARQKENLPLPDRTAQPVEYLSVKYSMPPWLVEMWMEAYGADRTETLLEGLLAIHPVSLRFRTDMSGEEQEKLRQAMAQAGVRLRESSLLPYVCLVEHTENIAELPGFAEGKFIVQDASSAMAVEAAGIRPGDYVVDICAAPGGKSILAAEKAGKAAPAGKAGSAEENAAGQAEYAEGAGRKDRAGRVIARDVSEGKVALLRENIARMGAENITASVFDATVTDETLRGQADVVLADVPCSGLGVMGKKRDIKYHVSPEKIADIIKLQKEIIRGSWQYVKPGGVLLYSTCTINQAENEGMVRWILDEFPFGLEEERQFIPGEDETDGFYYARLRRRVHNGQ